MIDAGRAAGTRAARAQRMIAARAAYTLSLPRGGRLALGARTLVMGVLNVTPDSFSDGGQALDPGQALDRALAMEAAGADLIDVGAESTRPGAPTLTGREERARLMPVLRRLHDVRVPLSIDTTKAEVARFALDEGVSLLNDISGLQYDPGVGDIAAVRGAPLVLMHMRGRPADMYAHAEYDDVATDVARDLTRAIERAVEPGRALGSDRRRPGPRLRQARRAQRRGPCRPRHAGRAGPTGAGRSVAQVVPGRGRRRGAGRGTRLADRRGGDRRRACRRPHRPRARGAGNGAGGAGRGYDSTAAPRGWCWPLERSR